MSLVIRPEGADDVEAIRKVLLAAFPTGLEADLVECLRQDRDSRISLVADAGGRIVGHVMLSRMKVAADGRDYRALGLGPAAVIPQRQREGIGRVLIESALSAAQGIGEELIFVLGEPTYYARFGFSTETARSFASPYAGPYLMACTLTQFPLPARGRADYAAAFAALA